MRFRNLRVLTGTMLSVLIAAGAAHSAIARPVDKLNSEQRLSQMDTNPMPQTEPQPEPQVMPQPEQQVTGKISNIDGEQVTLEMPDGTSNQITIPQEDITRLDLKPGMDISAQLDEQNKVTSVSLASTDTNRMDTTIRREETTIQRSTTETTQPTPAPEVEQPTPQSTEPPPVRGMW